MIEDWYRNHQEEDLTQFLCANHVLKGKDASESQGSRAGPSMLPPQGRRVRRGCKRNKKWRRWSLHPQGAGWCRAGSGPGASDAPQTGRGAPSEAELGPDHITTPSGSAARAPHSASQPAC